MTQKAIDEGFDIVICADGAEICGKHKASQTCVSLKPVDINSVDTCATYPGSLTLKRMMMVK